MAGHFSGYPYSFGGGVNAPHITRYFIARGWIMPNETVLDAGCGTGYGTKMISQIAEKAIGADIDAGCIKQAQLYKEKYPEAYQNIEWKVLDLGKDEWPDVDVTISIENAEHVLGFDHFVEQIKKHTKRMFLVCVPFGGTSYAYKDEPESPATEKNDFVTEINLENTFVDEEWKCFQIWHYGYSVMGVFYKKEPEPIIPLIEGVQLW